MSESLTYEEKNPGAPGSEVRLDRIASPALLIGGVLTLVLFGAMFSTSKAAVLQSYLFAWVFWITMAIGAFALTLLHHTVRGSWGTSILRMVEAAGSGVQFIVFGLLFIPIALGSYDLYHWTHADEVAADLVLQHKEPWLNQSAFVIRAVLFILFWAALSWGLRQSSLREDKSLDGREAQRRTNYAAPGIVGLFLTLTAAMVDWVMSLDPHWYSTIMPVCFLISGGLGALCLGTFVVCKYSKVSPYKEIVTPSLLKDLGNMMLALTMFWSYITMSQYLIIWSGNLPEFTPFFVRRGVGGWEWVGNSLVFLGFFLPFLMLISPTTKKRPERLMRVALFIFVLRILEVYWYIIPFFHTRHTPMITLWDVIAFVGLGGIFFAVFGSQIRQAPLLPNYDQRLKEMAKHAH